MQYDKRNDALLLEEADLVGIEVPKKELMDFLLNGDDRRTATSVVGMGGLGKTTLVRNVYNDVSFKSHFESHVWVTVSETFKLEVLFKNVIKEIFAEEGRAIPQDMEGMDINRLKNIVKDALETKKYIVVFDDVWEVDHWNAIQLAFPRNKLGSRVVLTTRKIEVGEAASTSATGGFVYPLKPLPETTAMRLFCRKAFSGAISCPKHLEEICSHILLVCQGLPLAIEVIGSILATKGQRKEQWELFYKRLRVDRKHNSQLDKMIELLSLSYYDLPNHLKICFLYLSIFPEDQPIFTIDLIRLWIAEGFVERINDITDEEIAGSYLNELVDRCLVQVATTDEEGKLKSLETLCYIEAGEVDNIRTVTEIGKLVELRSLGIMKLKKEDGKELCSSLGNLTQLRALIVYSVNMEEVIDFEDLKSSHLPRLEILDLTGCLTKPPEWISSLHGLTRIQLENSKLSDDPLQCLQDLPNLIDVYLDNAYKGDCLCFKAGGFPKLKNLYITYLEELRWVTVEENAMPSLKLLEFRYCALMEDIPIGIENLKHLQDYICPMNL